MLNSSELAKASASTIAVGPGASGFLLTEYPRSGHVLLMTNEHVVNGEQKPFVITHRGRQFIARPPHEQEIDKEFDCSVTVLADGLVDPVTLPFSLDDLRAPQKGSLQTLTVGWPNGPDGRRQNDPSKDSPQTRLGNTDMSQITITSGNSKRYGVRMHADLQHGFSGSPVFGRHPNGDVVIFAMYAFIASKFNGGSDALFAIHADALRQRADTLVNRLRSTPK